MFEFKKELKATNETLKNLQTQLELAFASTAASTSCLYPGNANSPSRVLGTSTLTALLETKDARIKTLERQVQMLESENQRMKDSGGRLLQQLSRSVLARSQHSRIRHLSPPRPTSTSPLMFGSRVIHQNYHPHNHQLHHPLHHQHQIQDHHQSHHLHGSRHLKFTEPLTIGPLGGIEGGALVPHSHNFSTHDLNFKCQVSFVIVKGMSTVHNG